ncbi:unnamed protein product [Owenia fusiformis]|uniref:Dihydrolipoamide acetyltransferase component of pyruvate dehydrogenase complex n=1 Tax=Owenia fusiformis TaxID=6347 RepID=A0A8J1XVV3_OWEFU|nr:unnamed protein product [Owenia fusiformis]
MSSAFWKIFRKSGQTFANLQKLKTKTQSYNNVRGFYRHQALYGAIQINMPALSPTMTEGTIVKWYKKEGDPIAPGDALCDIQTDKAVMAMETEEEGILAKIIMPDNSKDVKLGTLIALIVEEGDDWKNVTVPDVSSSPAPDTPSQPAPEVSQTVAPSGGSVPGIEIKMPALSPTMTEGTIVKWYKEEGDVVAPGDVLCDIQTDKAVVAMETEEEGILAKILKPGNSENVVLGDLIALIVEEGADWKDVMIPGTTVAPPSAVPSAPQAISAESVVSTQTPIASSIGHITSGIVHGVGPAVRTLIDNYAIKLEDLRGTGPNGYLLKGDVLEWIRTKNLTPVTHAVEPPPQVSAPPPTTVAPPPRVPGQGYVDIPNSSVRSIIAKRLSESKITSPHSYTSIECKVTKAAQLRKKLLKEGTKVSMNDFIIKAVAVALQRVPEMNIVWEGDNPVQLQDIDISVAVATDSGLITPIVKNASGLGVEQISHNVKELAVKAREGKLQPQEFQGGSFTISNLGMFGVAEFTAVINPPQANIMAVGSSRLVLGTDNTPEPVLTVTLSSDARVVDQLLASQFLEAFKAILENPMLMLTSLPPRKRQVDTA